MSIAFKIRRGTLYMKTSLGALASCDQVWLTGRKSSEPTETVSSLALVPVCLKVYMGVKDDRILIEKARITHTDGPKNATF